MQFDDKAAALPKKKQYLYLRIFLLPILINYIHKSHRQMYGKFEQRLLPETG